MTQKLNTPFKLHSKCIEVEEPDVVLSKPFKEVHKEFPIPKLPTKNKAHQVDFITSQFSMTRAQTVVMRMKTTCIADIYFPFPARENEQRILHLLYSLAVLFPPCAFLEMQARMTAANFIKAVND